jgi:hypothetical protein
MLPERLARKKESKSGVKAAAAAKENGEGPSEDQKDPEAGMDRDVLINQR